MDSILFRWPMRIDYTSDNTERSSRNYTAPATMPANINITVTATSVADKTKASSATVIPVGDIPGYDVGVDYHAYGVDIDTTGFIAIYNQPQVRQAVQEQVQGWLTVARHSFTQVFGLQSPLARIAAQRQKLLSHRPIRKWPIFVLMCKT